MFVIGDMVLKLRLVLILMPHKAKSDCTYYQIANILPPGCILSTYEKTKVFNKFCCSVCINY